MIVWLLAALAGSSGGPRPPQDLAVMIVIAPAKAALKASSSLFVEAAAAELEPRSRLILQSAEQAGASAEQIEACPAAERYSCWVRALPETHRWAALVFVYPSGNGLSLATVWLDLDLSRRSLLAVDTTAPAAKDQAEQVLFDHAIETTPRTIAEPTLASLREAFVEIVEDRLRPALVDSGHWSPNGALIVDSETVGLPVLVDDIEVGRTAVGRLRLPGVITGPHRVTVGPGAPSDVAIAQGAEAQVVFIPPAAGPHPSRFIAEVAGLGLAGVGAIVLAIGAAQATDSTEYTCLRPPGSECSGAAPVGTGYDRDQLPSEGGTAVSAGPGYLALGAAFATGGLGLFGGASLIGDEEDAPVVAVLAALAIGVVTYGAITLAVGD